MDNANGMSAEQIIMQYGLIDMVEFVTRGVDMSDQKLAFESISKVGPGGNFLTDDLTMAMLRSDEFFDSEYMDLSGGYLDNAPSMWEIAHHKVEELVNNYKPTVPEKVQQAIQNHFKEKYMDKSVAKIGWE